MSVSQFVSRTFRKALCFNEYADDRDGTDRMTGDLCPTPSPGPRWHCQNGGWVSESVVIDRQHEAESFDLLPFLGQTTLTLLAVYGLCALIEWVRGARR